MKVAIPEEPALPGWRSPRMAVTLVVATVGLGLNLRAWILLGPRLAERPEVGPARYAVLVGLPLLVAAVVRIPVGVLTDRDGGRRAGLLLGGLLIGFAGLARLLLRDDPDGYHGGSPVRRFAEIVRLASTTSLSVLYALALGGLVAIAVYLPAYLSVVFDLRWLQALAVTGAVVAGAALA